MELTAGERVLVHLHGFWNAPEPSREATQAGIAEGARVLRSHVPRTLRALQEGDLADSRDARLRGVRRKVRVYGLTEAGIRRARALISDIDRIVVDVDGRPTPLGDARKALGLSPLAALAATDALGRFRPRVTEIERPDLIQREEDIAFLRRWFLGGASVAVVFGSRGMGKTAVGWAFAATVPKSVWIDLEADPDLAGFAASLAASTGNPAQRPVDPEGLAGLLAAALSAGKKLVVIDGYGDVAEPIVDALSAYVRRASPAGKLLVLAQESTPAYCRFYAKKDIDGGKVAERHLRGLDLEGCRTMIGRPDIGEEALRRIFLLTKGCPLYLRAIREGDEAPLRLHSRFTSAEIRLLLYSGRSPV